MFKLFQFYFKINNILLSLNFFNNILFSLNCFNINVYPPLRRKTRCIVFSFSIL